MLQGHDPRINKTSKGFELSTFAHYAVMARLFNDFAGIGEEKLCFEKSKTTPQLDDLSLFRVWDDPDFGKFGK